MKIGIVTHYYGSSNYGGILQAYALCRILNGMGHQAYQICYEATSNIPYALSPTQRVKAYLRPLFGWMKRAGYAVLCSPFEKEARKQLALRQAAVKCFSESAVPHTDTVYRACIPSTAKLQFDLYITGSDQVWHPNVVSAVYLLDFVPASIPKISYAASVVADEIPEQIGRRFGNSLKGYRAVSVREKNAVNMLQPLCPKPVEWVVDPVLLLSRTDWDSVCSQRGQGETYIFCYFLGGGEDLRALACGLADRSGLPIKTFPHLAGYQTTDDVFGDEQIWDAAPGDFLALIKNARYILTDSFHAAAFSLLYQKQFFVFERPLATGTMSERIYSLLELFGAPERFCDTKDKATLQYITSLPPLDYASPCPLFEAVKERSISFLKANLY